MTETVDTGFEDAIAGEKWVDPRAAEQPVVTATVTNDEISPPNLVMPQPDIPAPVSAPGLTDEGKQALKSLVRLPEKSAPELAQLARDFAMDIKERHVILAQHKLTDAQYDFIEQNNEFYRAALQTACIEWHAPLNTQDRIKVEAAAILEDSLIGLGARMQNKSEGLPGVIEAAKLFAKVAGVGEREAGGAAPGERFTINIDLGGDQRITVASTPAPNPTNPAAGQLAAPPD